jgi:hypothetical protein
MVVGSGLFSLLILERKILTQVNGLVKKADTPALGMYVR